jgi:hypothetical protein
MVVADWAWAMTIGAEAAMAARQMVSSLDKLVLHTGGLDNRAMLFYPMVIKA